MKFEFETSKSKTIHVNDDTLQLLEELRQRLENKGKLPTYDRVIKFALSYMEISSVLEHEGE
jgi:hypothetical protein